MNQNKTKYFFIFILSLVSLFLAFNHYPPIMSYFEGVPIYKDFLPFNNPLLVLSISEDPSTTGPFNTFGYAALMISRHISDYIGHSLSNIRLPSVIYGLIALFLLYVIINRWFNWKVALVSTFLLATNQHFLMFQHFLLVQMVTLVTILFCIERFQNLLTNNNKFAILSLGFACALATLHYWTGRWSAICILLFYLMDFERFSIWKYKSYLHFTNLQRIKTVLLVFISMVVMLTIFYPGNLLLLFSPDFIYPSLRTENYTNTWLNSIQSTHGTVFQSLSSYLYMIGNNLVYYFKYYILNRSNHPSDILLIQIPYPIEDIIVIVFSLLGIIISLKRKITYPVLFLLYILFITFFPALLSSSVSPQDLGNFYEDSGRIANVHEAVTTLGAHRVFFHIPFICIMAVFGIKYIYTYLIRKNFSPKLVFVFLLGIFFCFRLYGYFAEIKRFNSEIHSYNIDFTKSAKDGCLPVPDFPDFQEKRENHYNQIYYYRLARFVSKQLKTVTPNSNSIKLLYIPAANFTPCHYYHGDLNPNKGSPYYFPMYLTFYLQEKDVNVSYLVKNEDIKKPYLKKAIEVVDRYKQGKNLSSAGTSTGGHYPRNEQQEKIVKMFVVVIDWIENYKLGKKWLNSVREQTHYNSNILSIGNYFVNVTSNKIPDYLIITSKEELNYVLNKSEYKIALSLVSSENL